MGESSGGLLSYIYKGARALGSFFGYGEEQENGWDEVKSEGQNEKEDHEDDEDFNTVRMLSSLSLDSKVIFHINNYKLGNGYIGIIYAVYLISLSVKL